MRSRRFVTPVLAAGATVAVAAAMLVAPGSSRAADDEPPNAPGAPGEPTRWTAADKTGFGTAMGPRGGRASRAWFTLQGGSVSEAYYPDLGTPAVRDLELVVTDGQSWAERERQHAHSTTRVLDDRGLTFRQVTTARSGRWQLTKTVVTDPERSSVLVDVEVESRTDAPLQVYAMLDPALSNEGDDDTGGPLAGGLAAADGEAATALVARSGTAHATAGYAGTSSDPWTDLADDGTLDTEYAAQSPGNVVAAARLSGVTGTGRATHTTLALGFGPDSGAALSTARRSLARPFETTARAYADGWRDYLDGLDPVPASVAGHRREYETSLMELAASEDKTHRGGFIASPSMPWVWGHEVEGLSSPSGAYHLVWSRDLYQHATALLAAGDTAAARRAVRYLFGTQQKPDGSFPQNSTVDGTPHWTNLQLDEVALPLVLAWQTGMDDAATYRGVKKAADFLVEFRDEESGNPAPYTPQERWENQSGYSPGTIAAAVAGLVCAAELAEENGDDAAAARWRETADAWQRRVDDWTVTTNGPLSDDPYYLRLTKDGRPDAGTTYGLGDGGPSSVDQRRVVDPSFLELVRLGVKPADHPAVRSTLPVVDRELGVRTPQGEFWHRYSYDGYGETRTGEPWYLAEPDSGATLGRVWPIFSGERGEYELLAGDPSAARQRLDTMASTAAGGAQMPEQVWDDRPPAGGPGGLDPGDGTYSATPLSWTHAQFVRLAHSLDEGHPVEQPSVVACRYVRDDC
jgi:glucoamylase